MTGDSASVRLAIPAGVDPLAVTGPGDAVLAAIEASTGARLAMRGDAVSVSGGMRAVELATTALDSAFDIVRSGGVVEPGDMARPLAAGAGAHPRDAEPVLVYRGRAIRPKTAGQAHLVEAVRSHTLTFCLGPAGTGKTYLAMALAVAALERGDVGRIVLTRPVVEAGENLGFLPGTLEEKVDPYVRPLLDALFDLMDRERVARHLERGSIEVAPLAYMRGRTLNDAMVILDEAQNTTPGQMKMFLTRLGYNAKLVVTGDASQRDLPGLEGGLTHAREILGGIDDIAFVELGRADVVRHRLVGEIVRAYDAWDEGKGARRGHRA